MCMNKQWRSLRVLNLWEAKQTQISKMSNDAVLFLGGFGAFSLGEISRVFEEVKNLWLSTGITGLLV